MKGNKHMTDIMIIGAKIQYYRKQFSMTQEELAKKLGVSTQAVSKWEQKNSCPDITLLPQIADIFNISIDELFDRKGEKAIIYNAQQNLPWKDDEKLRFTVFCGHKLLTKKACKCIEGENLVNFNFHGVPYDIIGSAKFNCTNEKRSKFISNIVNKIKSD
ncbi:MAG: helix-turn-helix domain-containing protein [Oscillospiraceae bacterium]